MDREHLERLARNPHYKMSQKQLDELRRLQQDDVRSDPTFKKHDPTFKKHPTKLRKQSDGNAD